VYFRPDTKCCTYHPTLPNYLVGAALADGRPEMDEGRRRLRARIAARVSVTPRWLSAPRKMATLMKGSWVNTMGRSLLPRCPFFDLETGGCTIWPHWEAVCSTFFCKYVAAADGEVFWRSLRAYLGFIERRLAIAAASAVMPGHASEPDPDSPMTVEDLEDRPPTDETYVGLWGHATGREEEHYLRCHEWVRALTRAEFDAIVGDDEGARRLERLAATLGALLCPALPTKLIRSEDVEVELVENGVLVRSWDLYEPILLPEHLFEKLGAFDGRRTVAEAQAELQRDGTAISDDWLVTLHRMRVLVIPEQAAAERLP
jgi:hypothetical protein